MPRLCRSSVMPYSDPAQQKRAQAEWYQKNKEKLRPSRIEAGRKFKNRARIYLREYLEAHPCVRCGEADPVVLEFHHRDPALKRFEVTRVRDRHSVDGAAVREEIAKCDVLCANCHRRVHYELRCG